MPIFSANLVSIPLLRALKNIEAKKNAFNQQSSKVT